MRFWQTASGGPCEFGYLNRSPIGIIRQVGRPTYDAGARPQIPSSRDVAPGTPTECLAKLIGSGGTVV